LECLLAADTQVTALRSLRAHFDRPVGLDEEIAFHWQVSDHRILGSAESETGRVMRLSLQPDATQSRRWNGSCVLAPLICQNKQMEDLVDQSGSLELALPDSFAELFPHLAARFSPTQAAMLLAATRLVGMICPGRHSIFSGLSLKCAPEPSIANTMDYAVVRADARVRLVDIAVSGSGFQGKLETFLRPEPVPQPTFAALRDTVLPDIFKGQRALVIGGSRGLGELTAKLLAIGGANVTVTYFHGVEDAARIVREAAAAGHAVQTLHFDIRNPPAQAQAGGFTHAYYFATPRITTGPARGFSTAILERYLEHYVVGFARSLEWLRPRAAADLCVWYPSSVFVEDAPSGLAEYAVAKACGETLCAQLSARLRPAKVMFDRLPRLATDQTQSLTPLAMADGVAVLRSVLLRLA
jgi:hypothetical protein